MHDHSADILGNEHLSTSRPPPSRFTPQWLAVYAVCLAALYIVGHTAWRRVLHWRERSSRLAMRRRYGIPDSDMRPFNVAYADAVNKRSDEEKRRLRPNPARPPALPPQREAELEQNLRHRAGLSPMPDGRGHTPNTTARSNSSTYNNVPANSTKTYMDHNPGQFTHEPTTVKGLARSRGYFNVQDANATVEDGKKRAFDEDMGFDRSHEAKKSRVNAVALEPTEDASSLQRGEKRGLGDDEGEDLTSFMESRGKRARQVSHHALQRQDGDQSMDIDSALEAEEDEDEITELRSPVRGKKRDRAEAGSTFGGDDDDEHVQAEDEKHRRRRQKRRTVAKRLSEASFARGKKRDAEDEEEEEVSDEEGSGSPERRRRKSKRQTLRDSRSMNSDISMTDSTRSRVREIGEEWESNGVKYKIGPNYDKLKQALVKKARQKFVMPQDSQHPDRNTNFEVYVECWLTEEEYTEAKKQHQLAWQDSPAKETPEKLTVKTTHPLSLPPPAPPQPTGKTLLWSAPTSTNTTPVGSPASSVEPPDAYGRQGRRRDPFRESIANQPLSPFAVPSNLPSARRIATNPQANYAMYVSTSRPPVSPGANGAVSFPSSPVIGESVLGSPRYRTYSKWEKQELEANAMMRVRAANAKKEEEARRAKEDQERQLRERLVREKAEKEQREQKERAEKERKDKEAAASAAAASTIPTITVTPASTSGTAPASGFSFGPSSASGGASSSAAPKNLFAPTPSASASAAPATSPAAPTTEPRNFSFAPTAAAPAAGAVPKPPSTFSFANAAPLGGGGSGATEPAKEAGSAGGSSLLPRLGTQSAFGPPTTATEAKPAGTTSGFVGSRPSARKVDRPFGRPSANALGTAPANPAPAVPPASSASDSATPKFSFSGFGPANTAAPAAPSAFGAPATNGSSSSLNGALGGTSDSKASGSAFSFKIPGAPASATAHASGASAASNQPGVNPTAPKFNFNTTSTSNSAPSPFGNLSSSASLTEPAKDTAAAPKFNFNSTTAPSAFGNSGASTTPAGAEPAKDAATKPGFNFGTSTASSNLFGRNTSSANPSSFGGNTSSTNPNPFGSSGSTTSAFGKPAGGATSAFGTTNESNSSGSVFGATSKAGASNPFGAAKNAFGTTPAAGTSAFGAATNAATSSTDKPAEAAKPMFSFTPSAAPAAAATSAPASGFSFGSTSSATPAGAPSGSAAPAPTSGGFAFNFGGGASGGAAAPKPSPFGAAPAANPFGAAPATNAFGSTTSTGAFSFGNTAPK